MFAEKRGKFPLGYLKKRGETGNNSCETRRKNVLYAEELARSGFVFALYAEKMARTARE